MIIEHELLEQIADDATGWPLTRAPTFVAAHKEPWAVIQALHHDGCLSFHDNIGELPAWKTDAIFRQGDISVGDVFIRITQIGENRVR